MSDFQNDADEIASKLGNALCLAKWQQTSLHLTNGMTNSCYHPPLHKIDASLLENNPGALHNTSHKKQQRKLMLEGKRPDECSYCWNAEDLGHMSDRHYRSGEPWAKVHLQRIQNQAWDADEVPSYVEVNFSNVCNLECSYCSPQFSSKWAAQIEQYGAYPTTVPHNDPGFFKKNPVIPNREDNPYVTAFWKWWPQLYPQLKHFRMTGGEPLMDKNTYKVFDYVLANPKPDLHLNVTSNFSVEPALFETYIRKVKQLCDGENIEHFMQFVSIDTWGEQAEYIRRGLNFDRFKANVERYLTEIPGRNSLTFIVTMNNLVVPGIQELLKWILELRKKHSTTYQRIWLDTPLLYGPVWQSLRILPAAYQWKLWTVFQWMKENISEDYAGFKEYETYRMERNLDWMTEGLTDVGRADFYKFFTEYDRRHGTSFLATFPQMSQFWDECKYLNDLSN